MTPLSLLRFRIASGLPPAASKEGLRRLDEFIRGHGVHLSGSRPCLQRMIGKRTCRLCRCPELVNGDGTIWDHVHLWLDPGGRPAIVTMEPYDPEPSDLVAATEALHPLGLAVRTSRSGSWWYPGETTLIEITRKIKKPPSDAAQAPGIESGRPA
jgi:hypothetical protein